MLVIKTVLEVFMTVSALCSKEYLWPGKSISLRKDIISAIPQDYWRRQTRQDETFSFSSAVCYVNGSFHSARVSPSSSRTWSIGTCIYCSFFPSLHWGSALAFSWLCDHTRALPWTSWGAPFSLGTGEVKLQREQEAKRKKRVVSQACLPLFASGQTNMLLQT